jgi:hypothetical protein
MIRLHLLVTMVLLAMPQLRAQSRRPIPQALVIFADVTGSLSQTQYNNIVGQFQTLVKELPRTFTIETYTITENAGFDAPIFSGQGLADADTTALAKGGVDLAKAVSILNDRYRTRKAGHEQQTCILNSLEFLCQHLHKLKTTHQRITVLYLSDMLEDCGDTPAGEPIVMHKQQSDYSRQQRALAKIQRNTTCLSGCEFTAVLPGEFTQASLPSLLGFWRAALDIYGLPNAHAFTLLRNELPASLPLVNKP